MSAAPINPSDLARIRQMQGTAMETNFICGIEGSGTVVACGSGLLPRLWLGKRVACSSLAPASGTWAGYMVTSAMHCIPLPAGINYEQGAMMLVNPMTAVAFIDISRKKGHKAIVNTASASSLGRMLELLAHQQGIPLVNIVRNNKQKQDLLASGSIHVLSSADEDFPGSFSELARQLKASLILDAVGGQLTRLLLMAAPPGSDIVIYGNLSGEEPEIDHRSIVTENKKVSGFFLGNWLKEGSLLNKVYTIIRVRKLLKREFTIPVQGRFSLHNAQEAVDAYLGNMTAGKVLLIPDGA